MCYLCSGTSKTYSCNFHFVSGLCYWGRIRVLRVRVPVAMTSEYQNSPIAPIGVNTPTEQLQEQTLQETNHNEEETPVGVLDEVTEPVSVANCHLLLLMTSNQSFRRTIAKQPSFRKMFESERMTINAEHRGAMKGDLYVKRGGIRTIYTPLRTRKRDCWFY